MSEFRKPRGIALYRLILWIGIVLIVGSILSVGFHEGRKIYWDAKVRELCANDGGIKVFESVELPKEQYERLLNQFGQLSPPLESRAPADAPIVRRNASSYIRQGNPEIRRDELLLVRRSDRKVLGISVSYSRVGGDFFALHPSYFSCPEQSGNVFAAVIQPTKR